MIGVDTNVLVRFVVADDEKQAAMAKTLVTKARENGPLFINLIVLVEFAWTLASSYSIPRGQVAGIVRDLLASTEFEFERRALVTEAIIAAESSGSGLADALVAAINKQAGCETTATFDSRALRLADMTDLKALL